MLAWSKRSLLAASGRPGGRPMGQRLLSVPDRTTGWAGQAQDGHARATPSRTAWAFVAQRQKG